MFIKEAERAVNPTHRVQVEVLEQDRWEIKDRRTYWLIATPKIKCLTYDPRGTKKDVYIVSDRSQHDLEEAIREKHVLLECEGLRV
jgi:hypothetical protein